MEGAEYSKLMDVVWVDPERMGGVACFRGTRVPVESLFDWLAMGETVEYFLEQFPTVRREQTTVLMEWAMRKVCEESRAHGYCFTGRISD